MAFGCTVNSSSSDEVSDSESEAAKNLEPDIFQLYTINKQDRSFVLTNNNHNIWTEILMQSQRNILQRQQLLAQKTTLVLAHSNP